MANLSIEINNPSARDDAQRGQIVRGLPPPVTKSGRTAGVELRWRWASLLDVPKLRWRAEVESHWWRASLLNITKPWRRARTGFNRWRTASFPNVNGLVFRFRNVNPADNPLWRFIYIFDARRPLRYCDSFAVIVPAGAAYAASDEQCRKCGENNNLHCGFFWLRLASMANQC